MCTFLLLMILQLKFIHGHPQGPATCDWTTDANDAMMRTVDTTDTTQWFLSTTEAYYTPSQVMNITINSSPNWSFLGLLMYAEKIDDSSERFGNFSKTNEIGYGGSTTPESCKDTGNTATHIRDESYQLVVKTTPYNIEWTPPNNDVGPLIFKVLSLVGEKLGPPNYDQKSWFVTYNMTLHSPASAPSPTSSPTSSLTPSPTLSPTPSSTPSHAPTIGVTSTQAPPPTVRETSTQVPPPTQSPSAEGFGTPKDNESSTISLSIFLLLIPVLAELLLV